MATRQCSREAEVIRAAWGEGGRAPLHDELAAHLADCPACAQTAALARLFHDERELLVAAAHPPSAGAVWWRSQRRAREEAARKAARPIALVHGVALGCAAAAAAAVAAYGVNGVREVVGRFDGLASRWQAAVPSVPGGPVTLPHVAVLMLAVALILAPVAIYLALSEE